MPGINDYRHITATKTTTATIATTKTTPPPPPPSLFCTNDR